MAEVTNVYALMDISSLLQREQVLQEVMCYIWDWRSLVGDDLFFYPFLAILIWRMLLVKCQGEAHFESQLLLAEKARNDCRECAGSLGCDYKTFLYY